MLKRHDSRRRRAWGGIVFAGLFGLSSIFSPATVSAQHPEYCPPAQPVPQYCPPGTTHPGIPAQPTPVTPGTPAPGTPNVDPGQPQVDPGQPQVDPGQQNVDPQPNQPQIFQPPAEQPNFDVAGSGNQSLAPGMIGDFFGGGGSEVLVTPLVGLPFLATVPNPATSVVGRQKIVEGASAMPRDRLFLNYSYFDNTSLLSGGVNVNRVTAGFEKTFLDGNASFEFRVPFAATLDSDINFTNGPDTSNWEFGNINMALKALLIANDQFSLAAGLALTVPTADDLVFTDFAGPGTDDLRIENNSVHILPFLGFLSTPRGSRLYTQGFLQLDFDANGNDISINGTNAGTINDNTFLYASYGIGYRMMQANDGFLRSVNPTAEIHYSRNLTAGDALVVADNDSVTLNAENKIEVINLVLGANMQLGDSSQLTVGYGIPLNTGRDQQFDGELRVMLNILGGGGTSFLNRSR